VNGHWHVAYGLAGYGPDGSDGFDSVTTWEALAFIVACRLQDSAESEDMTAGSLAESGDFESAWHTHKRADELSVLAMNFDNKRANAPLYRDDKPAWHSTIERLAREHFPLDVTDNTRLYVWECGMPGECEHVGEED
jgi:hypothetical protein